MYSLLLSGHMFGHSESNCNWEEEGNVFGRKNEDGVRDVIQYGHSVRTAAREACRTWISASNSEKWNLCRTWHISIKQREEELD